MTPESARYLVEGVDRPWLAADDVTEPAREIRPELRFLPPDDAFYVSRAGSASAGSCPAATARPAPTTTRCRRSSPRRSQLAVFYWAEGASDYLAAIGELFADGRPSSLEPAPFVARLARDLPSPIAQAARSCLS